MKKVVFTIVAKNYIGLAMVLGKSLKATQGIEFYIFVADEFDKGDKEQQELPANVFFVKEKIDIDEKGWKEMAFKYNLVEFCTAVKPHCFHYFLKQHAADSVIYLDPDIYLFDSLDIVYHELENNSILLTPHITEGHIEYNGDHPDYLFLINGVFNLGFLAVANTTATMQMVEWWRNRLRHQCFFDNEKGMATDQKWMNMLPAFFEPGTLKISRNMGLNLAPWNLFERKIVEENGRLYVVKRDIPSDDQKTPLVFVHFSGYNYKNLVNNVIEHKNEDLAVYQDMQPVYEQYAKALNDTCFKKYIHLTYSYNVFNNGKIIISMNRRLLRRMVEENINAYDDPFETGQNSFYQKLERHRLIDHSVVSADTVTSKSIGGFGKKIKLVNFTFKALQRIIGIRRYSMLIRFLRRYFREENQYFLFDNKSTKDFY